MLIINPSNYFEWPKILPKNFRYRGKHYIHYAVKEKNMEMLDKAITDKHDFKLRDNLGKNVFHYLFNENPSSEKSVYGKVNLFEYAFFEKLILADKRAWTSRNNIDFFSYFKRKIINCISGVPLKYNVKEYEKIIELFNNTTSLLSKLRINLDISSQEFIEIKFNSTILGPVIKEALINSSEREQCFISFIETLQYFNSPMPEIIDHKEKKSPFFSIEDEYGYYSNKHIGILFASSGRGKSMYLANSLLSGFVLDSKQDQEKIWDMWQEYILDTLELKNFINSNPQLFNLLQEQHKYVASKMLSCNLEKELFSNTCNKNIVKV